ncbi:MAG: ATP-binding cassette domain-containing protein [Lachnospira sp.]
MAVVKIENFKKVIKGTVILDNINIQFNGGMIYGLKGVNGSGKTMLMRAVAGLILPTEGHVYIDDKELGKDISFPPSIGMLLENPAFINYLTGIDNLRMIASIKGIITEEEIRNALIKVGLEPDDKRTFKKYSLGMKQRLGIAAAIMGSPEIVILDEPMNALDENAMGMVRGVMSELKENGSLVIIACHDTEELIQLADKVVRIIEGKIIGE